METQLPLWGDRRTITEARRFRVPFSKESIACFAELVADGLREPFEVFAARVIEKRYAADARRGVPLGEASPEEIRIFQRAIHEPVDDGQVVTLFLTEATGRYLEALATALHVAPAELMRVEVNYHLPP